MLRRRCCPPGRASTRGRADGATGREMLRRADEQKAVATADVEHRLVAAEIETAQQPVARAQLARPAAVDHEQGGEGERDPHPAGHRAETMQAARRREKPERHPDDEQRDGERGEAHDDPGRVEPVVHACSAQRIVRCLRASCGGRRLGHGFFGMVAESGALHLTASLPDRSAHRAMRMAAVNPPSHTARTTARAACRRARFVRRRR
jgi:hypothetical protein